MRNTSKPPIASITSIHGSLPNGLSKKTLKEKQKEAVFVYALLRAIPSTLFSLSSRCPQVEGVHRATFSNNPSRQKQVQCGAGYQETHEAVVEALLAAAAHITNRHHTTTSAAILEAIATDSNTYSTVSSLSDKGSPTQTNAKHQHRNQAL